MATETTNEKDTKKNGGAALTATSESAPDGFAKIQVDRPSFQAENFLQREEGGSKIEKYIGPALQGLLASYVSMGNQVDEDGVTRDMNAYIIVATAPTVGFDRDGKRVDIKVGDEILLWPNVKLDQAIEAATGVDPKSAATHPTHMIELWILPLSRGPFKSKSGETRRMWSFDCRAKPKPVARNTQKVALNVLAGANVPVLANTGN